LCASVGTIKSIWTYTLFLDTIHPDQQNFNLSKNLYNFNCFPVHFVSNMGCHNT